MGHEVREKSQHAEKPVTLCACGCGEAVTGRQKYLGTACRTRASRDRNSTAELAKAATREMKRRRNEYYDPLLAAYKEEMKEYKKRRDNFRQMKLDDRVGESYLVENFPKVEYAPPVVPDRPVKPVKPSHLEFSTDEAVREAAIAKRLAKAKKKAKVPTPDSNIPRSIFIKGVIQEGGEVYPHAVDPEAVKAEDRKNIAKAKQIAAETPRKRGRWRYEPPQEA